jgi:hypothetical protein
MLGFDDGLEFSIVEKSFAMAGSFKGVKWHRANPQF